MNKKVIPCRVREEYVEGAGVAAGAVGSGGDAVLQMEFGPRWEGLVKYVTFRDARKENPVTVILTTDMIERIVAPGRTDCHGPHGGPRNDEQREIFVYNVPIPAKAKALAGQMGVVVLGYGLSEDGTRVEGAVMTANAYYKILPADYADVEDGSVTPTLSQQLQGQIEAIKKDIVGAAAAADAKEAAQRAAAEAQAHRDRAEKKAGEAEDSAQAAAGSAGEAKTAAGEAGSAQAAAQAAMERSEAARLGSETAREKAELAQAGAETARDAAQLAQVGAEEAADLGKLYRDEALSARDAAGEAQDGAEAAKEAAVSAKERAEECRTQAWMERALAQDARAGAEEARDQAGLFRDDAQTSRKESQEARDEAVLALQWIRMEQGDIREEQKEIKELGTEVRRLREETGTDREAAEKAAQAAREAQTGAEKAQAGAVQARLGAEEAERKAQEWAETARDLSGGDVATRREAKGYVEAHNADPLAHEGVFPRIGYVAGERVRDGWRPEYGLGGGGERSVALEVEDYTGRAYLSAVVSGVEYDAVNLETEEEVAGDGTLIVRKGGEGGNKGG